MMGFFVCFVVHDTHNVRLHNFINLFCVLERSGHTTSVTLTTHTPFTMCSTCQFVLLWSSSLQDDWSRLLQVSFNSLHFETLADKYFLQCLVYTDVSGAECAGPKLQVNMFQVLTLGGSTKPRNDCSGSNESERSAIKLKQKWMLKLVKN